MIPCLVKCLSGKKVSYSKAVQIHPGDNLAVVLNDVKFGDIVNVVSDINVLGIKAKSNIIFES